MKSKINTRLWCSIVGAFAAPLAVGLPKLDPSNFWLALLGLLALSVSAACLTVVTFYEKLINNENKTE